MLCVCVICIPLSATVKLIGLSEASVAPPKPFTLLAVTGARPSRITLQKGRASSLRVSSQLMCLLLSWPHTSCIYFSPLTLFPHLKNAPPVLQYFNTAACFTSAYIMLWQYRTVWQHQLMLTGVNHVMCNVFICKENKNTNRTGNCGLWRVRSTMYTHRRPKNKKLFLHS